MNRESMHMCMLSGSRLRDYLSAPGLNRSDRSSGVAAPPSHGYRGGSTLKISCIVRKKEEWEYWVLLKYGTPFTFLCTSCEMMMNGRVLLGSSPPSLSSHTVRSTRGPDTRQTT